MKVIVLIYLVLYSFFLSASSVFDKNNERVFSCDLEDEGSLNAYFNGIDKTLYFSVKGSERDVIYKPIKGMELVNYQWVYISLRDPEYIPLKFSVDDSRNAYFRMTKGGVSLRIVDAERVYDDNNAITYYCIDGTASAFEPSVRRQIEHVQPNEFEAWD